MRTTVLWAVAAVAGVLLVAGITAAASTLTTQSIGLSSEPLSAGDQLAPAATPTPTATPARKRKQRPKRTPTPTPTAAPTTAPVPTVDDHGGDDDNSGPGGGDDSRGRGGGDDD